LGKWEEGEGEEKETDLARILQSTTVIKQGRGKKILIAIGRKTGKETKGGRRHLLEGRLRNRGQIENGLLCGDRKIARGWE